MKTTDEYYVKSKTGKTLTALYRSKIGIYEYEKYQAFFECRKMKRKVELIQASINRNEKISLKKIETIVQKESEEYQAYLDDLVKNINSAKKYLELPMISEEEHKELKRYYYIIAKKIHPDIATETDKTKYLWEQTQFAYLNNLLDLMITIYEQVVSLEVVNEFACVDAIEQLQIKKEKLEKRIENYQKRIENMLNQFPWNKSELINDDERTTNHIKEIKDEIKSYNEVLKRYQNIYDSYKRRGLE